MCKELKLISPIAPTVNHYIQYRISKVCGKNIIVPYPSKETKEYKKYFIPYIQSEVKRQGWEIDKTGTQHYYVDWDIYFPRLNMDASNQDKVIIDTITETEVVWVDDNVVCNRINHIYYDSKNPHIELTIKAVDYVGIFNNKEELNKFEDECKNCNRYKRNCSILKNAKLGRIQDEVSNFECSKYKAAKQ